MKPQALMASLEQARMPYTVFRHATAFTAQNEAEVSHVPGRSWAKFVIFKSDSGETIVAARTRTLQSGCRAAASHGGSAARSPGIR